MAEQRSLSTASLYTWWYTGDSNRCGNSKGEGYSNRGGNSNGEVYKLQCCLLLHMVSLGVTGYSNRWGNSDGVGDSLQSCLLVQLELIGAQAASQSATSASNSS